MKILVFGPRGYLGQQFLALFPDALPADGDIAEPEQVRSVLDAQKPDVVINAAGKTGRPNIDWCEDHKAETMRANVTGPLVLLEECAKRGIYLVHLSSGCIYEGDNGRRGFTEEDPPNFTGSFYSRTKALVDQLLKEFANQVLVLRLRMPFDGSDSPRSLISKLRNYDRVLDVQNSLTYMPDFMSAARQLILQKETGVFNVVNSGTISPYQIMQLYTEIVDPSHTFDRLTPDEAPAVTKAERSNCFLNGEKLCALGITLRPVEEAIRLSLQEIREREAISVSA